MFTVSTKASDATALARQNRRIEKLRSQGISRATVFVHHECKEALEELRPLFVNPDQASSLNELIGSIKEKIAPTNISQVKHLSPFRYPGGKTWLIPEIRNWIFSFKSKPEYFVEPFAGGAMAGLTVAHENLAKKVILSELDDDVAAVWNLIFNGSDADVNWLSKRISDFDVGHDTVSDIIEEIPRSIRKIAFRTIIKNRMQRGGIMAPGAGLVKNGESGKGLMSRWYPETLVKRISALRAIKNRIRFIHGEADSVISEYSANQNAVFFVDPPYTAGGKNAGKRLYKHNDIDHAALFKSISKISGKAMLTYDNSEEVKSMAAKHDFLIEYIPMKNTHHEVIRELLIFKV